MKILRHSAEWMRSVGTAPGGSKTNWLTAVILYDDAQLAHAASAKCREIEQNVGSAKIYALRTINLNTLPDNQQSSQMASTEAASADLVFLCVHPDRQLTRWTQLWMRDWASNRSNPRGALVHFCHQGALWGLAKLADARISRNGGFPGSNGVGRNQRGGRNGSAGSDFDRIELKLTFLILHRRGG